VLVVDDNVDAAEMTVEVLDLWGYAAESVHSGMAALRRAEQRMPDLILMDIGMPGMDGYEVTRELRRRPGGRVPYIIALTGYGQRDDVQRALAAGMDAHLTKPVDLDALRRLLQGAEATRPRPSEGPLTSVS
jgi:CheY-like chemotaxis protein